MRDYCRFIRLFYIIVALALFIDSSAQTQAQSYQGVTIAPSYSYYMTGRTDRLKGYVFNVKDPSAMTTPGLVFLASGIEYKGEAYLHFNEIRFEVPALAGNYGSYRETGAKEQGKAQFYSVRSGDDIVGKFVIPLKSAQLVQGINEVEFFRNEGSNGFEILDARIENVSEKTAQLMDQTYHLLSRGRPATIRDFDYVVNYHGENIWHEKDIPEWAQRGKVNFYRAGIDYDHLERMFDMFREARINLVAVGIPRDPQSESYKRVKAFIDRCHDSGIYITAFNSLGGINLRELLLNPDLEEWISHDEYGAKRWRQPGKVFAADLANENYRNYELKHAAHQIDTGVDELYYDYAIGGTGDVLEFLADVRKIAREKGKQISIYGNCKGNILVDEVCDLTKSEGTTEAGVWEGKWVHNIPQARFYYAVGNGVKPYRSKYEGADPGVPNPGAYDVRDGMKFGWKKPIAEASAFQSHFCIAEAGKKLRDGWINQDNDIAKKTWSDIRNYYTFLDENQDLYTEVFTVADIAVLAPPLIPSFEVSLKREGFYNALSEMSIMYEVVLLHRLTSVKPLGNYEAVIIPNIHWVSDEQFKALTEFKKNGGVIYTIGSTPELQELADIYSSAEMFSTINTAEARNELRNKLDSLTGPPFITVEGAEYVVANLVHKRGTDRYIVHFVNYDKPIRDVRITLDLKKRIPQIQPEKIKLISPDKNTGDLEQISIAKTKMSFLMPSLEVYNVVVIH